jgi:excisionase family DNA binding protein
LFWPPCAFWAARRRGWKATGLAIFSNNTVSPLPALLSETSERKEYGMPKRKTPKPAPTEPAPQQEFMTVDEVAALLRCDPRSVLNRIHDGDLDAVKDRRRWLILVASYYSYKSNLRNRRPK